MLAADALLNGNRADAPAWQRLELAVVAVKVANAEIVDRAGLERGKAAGGLLRALFECEHRSATEIRAPVCLWCGATAVEDHDGQWSRPLLVEELGRLLGVLP